MLTKEQYYSWTGMLEVEMCARYRDSVRNYENEDPVFHVSDIQKKRDEGGWSIRGIQGDLLNRTLLEYSKDSGIIDVDFQSGVFRLNDFGRRYMRHMDPQI